jgi:hypothetical protein
VVAADTGPPAWVEIEVLPGQSALDFSEHAPALAYDLGVSEIRVVPVGPSRIRLELLLEPLEIFGSTLRQLRTDLVAFRRPTPSTVTKTAGRKPRARTPSGSPSMPAEWSTSLKGEPLRSLIQLTITVVVLTVAVVSIVVGNSPEPSWGAIGAVVGYWLK